MRKDWYNEPWFNAMFVNKFAFIGLMIFLYPTTLGAKTARTISGDCRNIEASLKTPAV